MKRDRVLAYVAFAIVCIVWGTTYLAIRVAVRSIPPFLLTGMRFVLAGTMLFAIARFRGESIPRGTRVIREVIVVALLMVGIGNLSVVWAEQWVPSGIAALLVATAPFWAALMERFRRNGEHIGMRRGLGMLIGFIGVALLVTPGATGALDLHFILGALAIQIGSIAWQYGTMRGKYNLADVSPFMLSAFQMIAGGLAVGLVGLSIGEAQRLTWTRDGIIGLAYLTTFGSLLAFTAYVYALKKLPMTSMSMYAYINPLVAVLLGWLILKEQLTWVSIVAMCIILGGVALVQTGGRRSNRTVEIQVAREESAA
jgi:drug/metabolite transporter (DMT)-like permease